MAKHRPEIQTTRHVTVRMRCTCGDPRCEPLMFAESVDAANDLDKAMHDATDAAQAKMQELCARLAEEDRVAAEAEEQARVEAAKVAAEEQERAKIAAEKGGDSPQS